MKERRATCACGALEVFCRGEPTKVSLCHCLDCQRRTGSAFGIAAFFERSAVTFSGKEKCFRRTADNGHAVAFHFCPTCGSTVYWEPERMPGLIAVATGAFADPSFPAPTQSVYPQRRHVWVADPNDTANAGQT